MLQSHSDRLMAIEGVVGTGIGQVGGSPCIHVYVVKDTPDLRAKIPTSIGGWDVLIVETGEVRALKSSGAAAKSRKSENS